MREMRVALLLIKYQQPIGNGGFFYPPVRLFALQGVLFNKAFVFMGNSGGKNYLVWKWGKTAGCQWFR